MVEHHILYAPPLFVEAAVVVHLILLELIPVMVAATVELEMAEVGAAPAGMPGRAVIQIQAPKTALMDLAVVVGVADSVVMQAEVAALAYLVKDLMAQGQLLSLLVVVVARGALMGLQASFSTATAAIMAVAAQASMVLAVVLAVVLAIKTTILSHQATLIP
jgi:hypothetical protein